MLFNETEQILNTETLTNTTFQQQYDKSIQKLPLCNTTEAYQNKEQIHTVKNCLQCISGMLQILDKECEINKIHIDAIERTSQEIYNAIEFLNNYLLENQESSIPVLYSLNQIVIEIIQSHTSMLACYQIQLQSRLAENLPLTMLNKQRIRQLLINCLDNSREAIKAAGKSNGCITISTSFDEKQKLIHLLIEDNGVGLSAEQQQNFFSPCNTSKSSGSGLGTNFCQDIVKMHGGVISASGKPGNGCCIHIDLPLLNLNIPT